MELQPETVFRALADPTRLRCIALLRAEGELCVCELTYALRMVQPKVSRHLAVLRESGLVTDRREGQWIHYRCHPELPEWAERVLDAALEAARDREPYREDRALLSGMPDRPASRCCA
ncbi:MAG TPA: metalloregulator ArsR/SmtB family transcription factor [Gammaproteobacteria bacterium]|nr:metalloregulator ArsR/SmtB family transcription factor [Gammaproteobacteria bacterium]